MYYFMLDQLVNVKMQIYTQTCTYEVCYRQNVRKLEEK